MGGIVYPATGVLTRHTGMQLLYRTYLDIYHLYVPQEGRPDRVAHMLTC
jgi:hypothetical protein